MPDPKPEQRNREAWLTDFTALLLPLVKERCGLTLDRGSYKVSCGFPSRGGTRNKNRTVGQCHHAVGRKTHELFIHPQLADPVEVGEVVAHEILHAALPAGTGHRKPFSRAAKALGLEGNPTATYAGEELKAKLQEIGEQLGEYPHESLSAFGGPKQSTRLLKVMCPLCGYVVRVTLKWLDEAGAPICPQCQVSMEEAGTGDQAQSPLYAVDQTVEYKVKNIRRTLREIQRGRNQYDPRWSLRMNRRGMDIQWWVMDWGEPTHPILLPNGDIQRDAEGNEVRIATLGPVQPRLTPAESREDALALLEALRDGTMTYKDIEVDDDDPDLDVDDPFFEDEGEESHDFEEEFTEEELELYEQAEREREQGRPKVAPEPEISLEERIRQLRGEE